MWTLAVQNSDELINLFSIWTTRKMHDFQGYFSRTFQDVKLQFPGPSGTKVILQDFPGPGIFQKKIQDFPGGVGTLIHIQHTVSGKSGPLYSHSTAYICIPWCTARDDASTSACIFPLCLKIIGQQIKSTNTLYNPEGTSFHAAEGGSWILISWIIWSYSKWQCDLHIFRSIRIAILPAQLPYNKLFTIHNRHRHNLCEIYATSMTLHILWIANYCIMLLLNSIHNVLWQS